MKKTNQFIGVDLKKNNNNLNYIDFSYANLNGVDVEGLEIKGSTLGPLYGYPDNLNEDFRIFKN